MASIITIAGEKLFAAKAQANEQLDIDTFIFANVPNQDSAEPISRDEELPNAYIVHQQAVQQVGRINENVVVYSTVLDSITGPFEFNWVGLYSSVNNTLVAINHIPVTSKTITAPGTAGNTLNRNFGIEYSGIADLTGINVAPETWQLDFTARLSGMDKLTRQLAKDLNGQDSFIGDGFKVSPHSTLNAFKVSPGVGYVNGLRIELLEEQFLIADSYPKNIYVDAYFDGDASSIWKPKHSLRITSEILEDYIDSAGQPHYLVKIAEVIAYDDVTDFRELFNFIDDKYNRKFQTVADAVSKLSLESTSYLDKLAASKAEFETVWNNAVSKKGGAKYLIKTLVQVGIDSDVVDGDFNFYVGKNNSHVAVLQNTGVLDLALGGFSPSLKTDWSSFIDAAFEKSKNLFSEFINGKFLITRPINIPLDGQLNLNLCKIDKGATYTANEEKVIIKFTGSNGYVAGIDGSEIVSAGEKLIGFQPGVNNCTEDNCRAPLSRFLLNEGVKNTNISKTLDRLVPQYGEAKSSGTKKVKLTVVTSKTGGGGDFRRVRYIPSICRITHIKVTDVSGAPDFAFTLEAKQGGSLVELFSRARTTSNIDMSVDIDWVHDDFDDVLPLRVTSWGDAGESFKVEISYEVGKRCNIQAAWFYSSNNDFLKPHKSNALNHAEGIRGVEYRSYINGLLNVQNILADRKPDTNYNWPHLTVPTPAGVRDTSESTELKFYLNYSAAQALRDGVTHLRVRLHETPAIKCTVLNGWLSQAYDGAPIPHLSTLGYQPNIEADFPASGVDDSAGATLLIPLDIKAMQQGALQSKSNDFNFFYLTFYQNLAGHLPIEWGDEWSFVFEFIREPGL